MSIPQILNVNALTKIGCGMYLISSYKGKKYNAQVANTVFQVAATPPTIAVSINKKNLTHEYMHESGMFTVSILAQTTPLSFIGKFGFKSGRDVDKFEGTNYKFGISKAPIILDNTVAYLEARVLHEVDVGTHTLFIGEVIGCDIVREDEAMSYDYYHIIKKGTTPKNAPGYIEKK